MQVGVIDLGRRGAHIVRRLLAGGHQCVVFDECPRRIAELAAERARGASSVSDLASELDAPRVIWLAVPASAVGRTIAELLPHLEAGDILIDSADSHYVDDIRRGADLGAAHIRYVDVGVSGGIGGGPDQTYCLTIGGDEAVVRALDPIFKQLAAEAGYLHCGPAGAGHFVNMIHDGIESCFMEAYAEGFSILRGANVGRMPRGADPQARRLTNLEHFRYEFNLRDVAEVWRHGSLIASSVLDQIACALAKTAMLEASSGSVRRNREDWPGIRAAVDEAVSVPVLAAATYLGGTARDETDFSRKLVAAVQQQVGSDVVEHSTR